MPEVLSTRETGPQCSQGEKSQTVPVEAKCARDHPNPKRRKDI